LAHFEEFMYIERMNILILEDEEILREKLATYVSDKVDQIYACSDLKTANDIIQNNKVDILVSDHQLPDGLGMDFIKSLKKAEIEIPACLLMTAHSELSLAIDSVNYGVDFFLEKPFKKAQFIEKIELLIKKVKDNSEVQELLNLFTIQENCREILTSEHDLSPREIEVIQYLFRFDKNELIAKKMHISAGTVKNHLANIYQKTYVANKRELKEFIQKLNSTQS
jgi:DNA-binding NarL/FixJ family response regulator